MHKITKYIIRFIFLCGQICTKLQSHEIEWKLDFCVCMWFVCGVRWMHFPTISLHGIALRSYSPLNLWTLRFVFRISLCFWLARWLPGWLIYWLLRLAGWLDSSITLWMWCLWIHTHSHTHSLTHSLSPWCVSRSPISKGVTFILLFFSIKLLTYQRPW